MPGTKLWILCKHVAVILHIFSNLLTFLFIYLLFSFFFVSREREKRKREEWEMQSSRL